VARTTADLQEGFGGFPFGFSGFLLSPSIIGDDIPADSQTADAQSSAADDQEVADDAPPVQRAPRRSRSARQVEPEADSILEPTVMSALLQMFAENELYLAPKNTQTFSPISIALRSTIGHSLGALPSGSRSLGIDNQEKASQ